MGKRRHTDISLRSDTCVDDSAGVGARHQHPHCPPRPDRCPRHWRLPHGLCLPPWPQPLPDGLQQHKTRTLARPMLVGLAVATPPSHARPPPPPQVLRTPPAPGAPLVPIVTAGPHSHNTPLRPPPCRPMCAHLPSASSSRQHTVLVVVEAWLQARDTMVELLDAGRRNRLGEEMK